LEQDGIIYTDKGEGIVLPPGDKRVFSSRNYKHFVVHNRYRNPDPEVFAWYKWYDSLTPVELGNLSLSKKDRKMLNTPLYLNQFIFMNYLGKEIWIKDVIHKWLFVSNDGKKVVAIPEGGSFSTASFYEENGNVVGKPTFVAGRRGAVDLSLDGQLFVVASGLSSKTGKSTIIAFDNNGNELWRKMLRGKSPFGKSLTISSNRENIAICLEEGWSSAWTYVLNKKGDLIYTADFLKHRRYLSPVRSFSKDGKYLALLDRDQVGLVDLKESKTLWRYNNPNGSYHNKWVDVSHSGDVVAFIYYLYENKKSYVEFSLINKDGIIVHKQRVDESAYYTPKIFFSPQGNYLLAHTRLNTAFYKINN
jgi:hypothetical protein